MVLCYLPSQLYSKLTSEIIDFETMTVGVKVEEDKLIKMEDIWIQW